MLSGALGRVAGPAGRFRRGPRCGWFLNEERGWAGRWRRWGASRDGGSRCGGAPVLGPGLPGGQRGLRPSGSAGDLDRPREWRARPVGGTAGGHRRLAAAALVLRVASLSLHRHPVRYQQSLEPCPLGAETAMRLKDVSGSRS